MAEAKEYWKKYQAGIKYNSTFRDEMDYYESNKVWHNFYNGDQWIGVGGNNEFPKMVFNIMKRVINFQIASVTSADTAVRVEPLQYTPHDKNMLDENGQVQLFDDDFVNAEIENIFEKWNFRSFKKNALRKGAISGDMCAHVIFNMDKKPFRGFAPEVKGEMEIELIDATNVYFGNANIKDVEKQPYIVISGRDLVKNLQAEAKGKKNKIKPDNNTGNQSSDYADFEVDIEDDDADGKATYIYVYEKIKDKVYVTKCTEEAIIYERQDTGYSRYPIAFENWYSQENTYHGRGEVEGLTPNQIALNKMFSMIVYHQMMGAFPPVLYDGDVLDEWTNEIGTAIRLDNMKGRNFRDVAGYLEPASMSADITQAIDLAMQYTKECMGVSDASLGNINPQNTSAIIAVQKSTAVPLENIKDNLYSFIEQIVNIIIDVMATKYGKRPVVVSREDGSREIIQYDFDKLKDMDLHLAIDVGEGSYYSEIVTNQTLDNLLTNGMIDIIDYLERIPNSIIPNKAELIKKFKEAQQGPMQNTANNYEAMAQFMETLPPDVQAQLQSLPPEQLEATVLQMMNQQ